MRFKTWITAVPAVLALVGLAGCSKEGTSQNTAEVRFLHAAVDAESLDILVDDDIKFSGVALASTTGYTSFDSGTRTIKLRSGANSAILVEKSQGFPSATGQTVVIYGKRSALQTTLLSEDTTSLDSGKFRLRVLGLSPDAGAMDLYVTTGDIAATPANLSSLGYATLYEGVQLAEGSYKIVLTTAGTKEVLFEVAARTFTAGARQTLVVLPSLGGKLVNAVLLGGGNGGVGTYLPNTRVRLRAVNADPGSSGFSFRAGAETLLSNVPYKGTSSYVLTASGSRGLSVEAVNVPGTAAASVTATLEPGRDYSLLATTAGGQAQLTLIADDNTAPASGRARLRFVNAFADVGTVDALLNFAGFATAIAPRAASAGNEIAPDDSYTASFTTPGGVSVVAALAPVKIESGYVYSLYGFGPPGAGEARLVRDR